MWKEPLERENLIRALKQVQQYRGAPGLDGMTVDALSGYLKVGWPRIQAELIEGRYRPAPVRRVLIPKPDGRMRQLGMPTVVDRFIQQAIAQVVQRLWEPHFLRGSDLALARPLVLAVMWLIINLNRSW